MSEKTYTVKIRTGNAAFEDDPHGELERAFLEIAKQVSEKGIEALEYIRCNDYNGNLFVKIYEGR